jgi:Transposase DDE domain
VAGGKAEPTKYWLSNLPETTPIVELVRLARSRWRVEQDYRELKGALGLDHFQGRGWVGWHHHVTLVSVAHGFLTLERRRRPNRRRRPELVAAAGRAASPARLLGRRLSAVQASRTTVATSNGTTTSPDMTESY